MARTNTLGNFLTDVADAIRTKKGSSDTILASDFDTEIENLPSGGGVVEAEEKDVNFYDHTGFRWYSYTKSEFLALESMPANPEIEGLTAQGWNWSFQDAQDYVEEYGGLDIGQTYITDDGKTRIYIELDDYRKEPYLGFGVNGTATVNWGDGNTETITGTSATTTIYTQHTYSTGGKYVISIGSESQIMLGGGYGTTRILTGGNSGSASSIDEFYARKIKKIELGSNLVLYRSIVAYSNVTSINMPKNIVLNDSGNQFISSTASGSKIKCIIFPDGLTDTYESRSFEAQRVILPNSIKPFLRQSNIQTSLNTIYIPSQVTRLLVNACNSRYDASYIVVPNSVTELNNQCFGNLYGTKVFDFSHHTSIPTLTTTSFANIPSDCKIVVPDDLYSTWLTTSNWSTYSSNIISKSDYDNL